MPDIAEVPVTKFAMRMQERMDERGLSIKDVADKMDSTYEYVRKLYRGLALPSKYMIRAIADVLEIEKDELERLMVEDRFRLKHGEAALESLRHLPADLEPVVRAWEHLSAQEKGIIRGQAETFYKQARRRRVAH